jgi:peptide/nickel transport system substrate-binding protein
MNNTRNSIPPIGRWVKRKKGPLWALLILALAAVAVAVALIAKGCSSRSVTPATTPTPTAAATLQVPRQGGTLKIPMPQNPGTLNPLKAATSDMVSIGWLTYESLLQYDDTGRIVAGVADSFSTSDGGKTWTFKLEKGIEWQRGGALKADDIVFTYGLIKSYDSDECIYKDKVVDRIEDMEAPDDQTLLVKAREKGRTVLDALCFPILSRAYAHARNIDTALPNGTGPYTVTSSDSSGLKLEANTKWWKQRAYIDKIEAVAVPDNESALSSFSAGALNMVPTQSITAESRSGSGDSGLISITTQRFECLVPNIRGKLSKLEMRQALSYALDTKEISDRAFLGHSVTVDTPIPPGHWLYDASTAVYEYKPKTAGEILDGLGWKMPEDETQKYRKNAQGRTLELKLLVDENLTSTVRKDMALAIKEQLAEVGINVVIESKSWDDYQDALDDRDFDLALCGFNLDRSLDLRPLLSSGGNINYSGYSNGDMNSLLDDFARSTDEDGAKSKMRGIQEKIVSDVPIISLCFRTYSMLTDGKTQSVEGLYDRYYYNHIERWYINDAAPKGT